MTKMTTTPTSARALSFAELRRIEREAENAPYTLLRWFVDKVAASLRQMADGMDAAYAQALLLKLDRLIEEQRTPEAIPVFSTASMTSSRRAWSARVLPGAPSSGSSPTTAAASPP